MAKLFAFDLKVKASFATARQKNKFFMDCVSNELLSFWGFCVKVKAFGKRKCDKGYVAYHD
jgi:hypothetical protein